MAMIETLAMAGGFLAAGFVAYRRVIGTDADSTQAVNKRRRGRVAEWLGHNQLRAGTAREKKIAVSQEQTGDGDPGVLFGLRASALSLGLATAGLFLPPSLIYASIPTLIYMGIPSAQAAYEDLRSEGRISLALAETAALAVCLAGGYLWAGSLGFTLYYAGRALADRRKAIVPTPRPIPSMPQTAFLYRDDGKVETPVASLQKGDRISLASGDLSPVEGLIVEGSALLKSAAVGWDGAEVWKEVGDRIRPLDLVVVGQICVRVRQ